MDLRWNCPAGTLELISFGARSDLLWDLQFPEIPSRGFLLDFPHWGLLCLFVCGELNISPLGFYYTSPFFGNYINSPKYNIAYVPLDPVSEYVYIADLNTRLRVG